MVTRREAILLLGVSPGADEAAVRAAFRKKVREQHPDTAAPGTDHSNVHGLIDAYRLLVDTRLQTGPLGSHQVQLRRTEQHILHDPAALSAVSRCRFRRGPEDMSSVPRRRAPDDPRPRLDPLLPLPTMPRFRAHPFRRPVPSM